MPPSPDDTCSGSCQFRNALLNVWNGPKLEIQFVLLTTNQLVLVKRKKKKKKRGMKMRPKGLGRQKTHSSSWNLLSASNLVNT
jgi:hypothetical protein